MKTAIVYHSEHHDNTKKLLDAIAVEGDVTLIKASDNKNTDLSAYDLIGFASGNYYSKFHDSVLEYAERYLPQGKKVFIIYTYGVQKDKCTVGIKQTLDSKSSQFLGDYGCKGFDTFGPFKLVGGVAKGHPNDEDIAGAVNFFKGISKQ